MFGRTPRLPVDVMFKQVLHDPVVVDYKSYAKTLMSHLHEAVRIAQEHSIKEQDKQASGYNRKVRGTHLNLGDRVLIANKGERGKKKLADKWSAIVYTVKDRNLQTHTYKLVDSSGNTKIVHRNLVLDISFLPVVTTGEDLCDTEVEERSYTTDPLDSLEEEEEEDSRGRTSTWIMSGSEETRSQMIMSERSSEVDQSSQGIPEVDWSADGPIQCFPNDQNRSSRDTNFDSLVAGADSDSSFMSHVHSGHLNTQSHPADTGHVTVTQVQSTVETEPVVRTRAGRVSKRVNRLIEFMVQKPFDLRGFVSSVNKRSQSLLTLF